MATCGSLGNCRGTPGPEPWARLWLGILLGIVSLSGCTTVVAKSPRKNTLLRPAQMSPDAVGLEIFFARFPLGDPEANEKLWKELDEQGLPASLRRELFKNGFRVGLVGTPVPVSLARLLSMSEEGNPSEKEGVNRVQMDAQQVEPWISCRRLSLRPGCRSEVVASGLYEEMTVLRPEAVGLAGQTFRKAQGVFALYVQPLRDGRVQVELIPEVHYGDPAQRWVGDQGMFRLEIRREKQAFPELAVRSILAPGEMLLLSCLPDREGSLGYYYFTQTHSGDPQQKLLLVRVAQTQHDGLFGADTTFPTDSSEPAGHPQ